VRGLAVSHPAATTVYINRPGCPINSFTTRARLLHLLQYVYDELQRPVLWLNRATTLLEAGRAMAPTMTEI